MAVWEAQGGVGGVLRILSDGHDGPGAKFKTQKTR